MKAFNLLFVAVIVGCIGLSFMGKSNFDNKALDSSVATTVDYRDSIPSKTLDKLDILLREQLLTPIRNCLEEKDPHIFMTKCYSQVSYDIQLDGPRVAGFRNGDIIRGQIIFTNCSQDAALTSFVADVEKGKIHLFESYKRPEVSVKEFLKEFKAYINKEGIPNGF